MRVVLIGIACGLVAAGCGQQRPPVAPPNPAALGAEILAAEAEEAAGWAARDLEQIMNAYAPDAIVLLGGAPPMDREALRELFVDFLGDPQFTLTFLSDQPFVAGSGDVGITVGRYELTYTDPSTREAARKAGKHLMAWKLQPDGQWRVIRQMTAHDTN